MENLKRSYTIFYTILDDYRMMRGVFFFESDFRSGRLSTKTFRFNILGGGVCFFRSENTLAHFMNLRIFLIKLAFLLMKYNTIVPIFKCKVGIFKTFL